ISDGGYIVTGCTIGERGHGLPAHTPFLMKIDSNGEEDWIKEMNHSRWYYNQLTIETLDDGFLVIGGYRDQIDMFKTNIEVIKTDGMGIVEWEKTFNFSTYDYISDVMVNSKGIVLAGFTLNRYADGGVDKGLLFCVSEQGDLLWVLKDEFENKLFYGVNSFDDDFIVTGVDQDSGLLLKTDESGEIKWEMTTTTVLGVSCVLDVVQTDDKALYFTGLTIPLYESGSFPDFFYSKIIIGKFDNQGVEEWQKTFIPKTAVTCEYLDNTWILQNKGIIGAYNVSVNQTIIIDGIFRQVQLQYTEQIIIFPGKEKQMKTPSLFGFGKVTMIVNINGINIDQTEARVTGFLIGPFFLRR
ncbi:MAG: hypothetical protein QCI00_07845, partial [Candidatus Thermoplasmatota archaeon]|nr:hypothetical protein [Candidatus Thermoplasmatota archaeon]